MKRIVSSLLTTVMMLSLVACGGGNTNTSNPTEKATEGIIESTSESISSQKETANINDTIVFGIADNLPGIFHPLLASKTTDQDVNKIIFPSLMQLNESGELVPYLAKSYEVSEDGLTLTFHLQENAVWHDNTPVTAEDVAYTIECITDPGFTGTAYSKVSSIVGADEYHNGKSDHVEGIKVIDEHTISFTLSTTFAPALSNIASRNILPKHIWKDIPVAEHENHAELMKAPIGCGPYKMTENVEGQYVTLEANESYWDGTPKTPNLVFKVLSVDSILAELKNGTVNVVSVRDLTGDDKASLEKMGYSITSFANNIYRYIGVNLRKPIFQDKALRDALYYALDRESIVSSLLEGNGSVINSPFLPASWAKEDTSRMVARGYDVEKAKEILNEAGYTDNNGDNILESPDGTQLSFTYKIPTDSALTEQVALIVQQCWKEIGINIEIQSYEYGELAQIAIFNHDFDFYTLNCQFGDDPDIFQWWHSSAATDEAGVPSFNFDGYKSETCDKLIEEARTTNDQATRKELCNEAARVIDEDAPMIFLYCQDNSYAYPQGMEGFAPYTFNVVYNINNWTIPAK